RCAFRAADVGTIRAESACRESAERENGSSYPNGTGAARREPRNCERALANFMRSRSNSAGARPGGVRHAQLRSADVIEARARAVGRRVRAGLTPARAACT